MQKEITILHINCTAIEEVVSLPLRSYAKKAIDPILPMVGYLLIASCSRQMQMKCGSNSIRKKGDILGKLQNSAPSGQVVLDPAFSIRAGRRGQVTNAKAPSKTDITLILYGW